jgi:hypothetical protein
MYDAEMKFDLEKAVKDWRQEMRKAGVEGAALEELEGHLREDLRAMVAGGEKEEKAFETAKASLGSAKAVEAEFRKIGDGRNWLIWAGAVLLGAVLTGQALLIHGKMATMLFAHTVAMTGGYEAVFLAGVLGCGYLMRPTSALWRGTGAFLWAAAAAIAVGFVLGMAWSKTQWGAGWRGSEREMGAINALVWTLAAAAAHYFGRRGNRAAILMSIGGSIIVAQAWFEPFAVASPEPWRFWPVAVFVGLNVCFLGVGLTGFNRRLEMASR